MNSDQEQRLSVVQELMKSFSRESFGNELDFIAFQIRQWCEARLEITQLTIRNNELEFEAGILRRNFQQLVEINNVDIKPEDHKNFADLLEAAESTRYEDFEDLAPPSKGVVALLKTHVAFIDPNKSYNLVTSLMLAVATKQNDLIDELCDTIDQRYGNDTLLTAAIKTALHADNSDALGQLLERAQPTRATIDFYADYSDRNRLNIDRSTMTMRDTVITLTEARVDAHAREFGKSESAPAPEAPA